jgi:D-lactate dehydrogenase
VPLHSKELPGGGSSRVRPAPEGELDAVYFPAFVGTMFGPIKGSPGIQQSFEELCARANVVLSVPSDIAGLCCGTPWSSKGMNYGRDSMRDRKLESPLLATQKTELPIFCGASSCAEGLLQSIADGDPEHRLVVIDAVEFISRHVLPTLPKVVKLKSLALHPTCSFTRLGTNAALEDIARSVAENVLIPDAWGCCAFAGDRGMLHPELTPAATAAQAFEVQAMGATAHASCNRTCELGMTRATGKPLRPRH